MTASSAMLGRIGLGYIDAFRVMVRNMNLISR